MQIKDKPLPSAYKLSALRNAESYEKKVLAREELIKELARQLNEGYKMIICTK